MLLLNRLSRVRHLLSIQHFNTSYVVIKPKQDIKSLDTSTNFNTSYVVIKRLVYLSPYPIKQYFNTSYVVIKRRNNGRCIINIAISIHLMLLLNR